MEALNEGSDNVFYPDRKYRKNCIGHSNANVEVDAEDSAEIKLCER